MNEPHHDENERNDLDIEIRSEWVIVAETVNRTLAEFAVNGLKSYDIPAALDARPGFLGTAGLQLRSLRDGRVETFKILTPAEFAEEAVEVVKIFIGDKVYSGDEVNDSMDDEEEG